MAQKRGSLPLLGRESLEVVGVGIAATKASLRAWGACARAIDLFASRSHASLVPTASPVVLVEGISHLSFLLVDSLLVPQLAVPPADPQLVLGEDGLPSAAALRLGHRKDSALRPQLAPLIHHSGHSILAHHDWNPHDGVVTAFGAEDLCRVAVEEEAAPADQAPQLHALDSVAVEGLRGDAHLQQHVLHRVICSGASDTNIGLILHTHAKSVHVVLGDPFTCATSVLAIVLLGLFSSFVRIGGNLLITWATWSWSRTCIARRCGLLGVLLSGGRDGQLLQLLLCSLEDGSLC
mmetsp:Transcript_1139/g.1807  ORF Transcript_1139/g.1807 Transcript_1139/m.1807 type:complete len:293 (-) Transcript_1139:88-966(-)